MGKLNEIIFSVIIPTYNDWKRLEICLDALLKQTYDGRCYEIIVVNNNEKGTVPGDVQLPEFIRVLHEPKPGSYAARNRGGKEANGEIIAFTDSDCIPDQNWLTNANNCFQQHECDLIGGRIEIFQEGKGNKYGYLYERFTAFQQYKNVPEGKGVTANLFVKKIVFKAVGGFNSEIKSGGDWEFTTNCIDQFYKMIYAEDVLVFHPARNLSTILKKQFRLTCGGAFNTKKIYGHSYLRMMGSHIINGLNLKRAYKTQPKMGEWMIIISIDLLKYMYRILIYTALLFGLVDPRKAR